MIKPEAFMVAYRNPMAAFGVSILDRKEVPSHRVILDHLKFCPDEPDQEYFIVDITPLYDIEAPGVPKHLEDRGRAKYVRVKLHLRGGEGEMQASSTSFLPITTIGDIAGKVESLKKGLGIPPNFTFVGEPELTYLWSFA